MPDRILDQLASLLSAKRYVELEQTARKLLAQDENIAFVWHALAVSLSAQGKDAVSACRRAVQLSPNSVNAHVSLAIAAADAGQFDVADASFQNALAINPSHVVVLNHMATSFLNLGRYEEALTSYRRVAQLEPSSAAVHSNLGDLLQHMCRFNEAITSYQHALGLDPALYYAHLNLGNTLRALGKRDQALLSYQHALALRPDSIDAYTSVATILRLQGKTDAAAAACSKALEIIPDAAAIMVVLGEVYADQGQFLEAEALFKQALQYNPQQAEAWYGAANLRKMSADDAAWCAEAQHIAAQPMPARQESYLRYAIAKFFDDVGKYDEAFSNYYRANELGKLIRPPHSRKILQQSVDHIVSTYDTSWLSRQRIAEKATARPVFIIGMMRSGTSLAEQILASHPAVHGAGELDFWSNATQQYESATSKNVSGESIIVELEHQHSTLLNHFSPTAQRVVDKTPTNFMFLGLIHAVLPNARIIHMQRNPIDTCLSIYFQNFESTISYANDLDDLAHCYKQYLRLMNHWRSTLPGDIFLDVQYEELINDPEKWCHTMVDFVDLPWDQRCLEFHLTNRTVVTASKWQVRQGIYKSSIQRWRNYEKFIAPLLALVE